MGYRLGSASREVTAPESSRPAALLGKKDRDADNGTAGITCLYAGRETGRKDVRPPCGFLSGSGQLFRAPAAVPGGERPSPGS